MSALRRRLLTRGAIDRGRHHGKSIVKVRHFNMVAANKQLDRIPLIADSISYSGRAFNLPVLLIELL